MPDTRSTPSRSRRSKGAPVSNAGSPTAASVPVTPTTGPDDWQKKNPQIGKVGKPSVAEKLVIRGNRNPNTRSKPMPLPNYGAIERRAK